MEDIPEDWVPILDFPSYAISSHGRVMRIDSQSMKVPYINQQGVASVLLSEVGQVPQRRGVALLVANVFLPVPPRRDFDTPINLDGDRLNNHVLNLAWRPRWFAIQYHNQLKQEVAYNFRARIELIETGEIFDDVRQCAVRYGLLEKDVIHACHNHTPLFIPQPFHFQLVVDH